MEVKKRSGRGRGRSRGRLTIVDYAHDEAAMPPELEEGEFYEDEDDNADDLQEKTTPGTVQVLTPTPHSFELLEVSQADEMNSAIVELEGVSNVDGESVDPLDKFLPPPPKEKCSEELQDIDQIRSCFANDVFDPHGYDQSDFYTQIEVSMSAEVAMRRERERKELELKKNHTPVVPGSGLPPPLEAVSRDGRPNKKSKWDKVDTDVRNPLSASDSLVAHAAQLSAANTGYSAFAQQKREKQKIKDPSKGSWADDLERSIAPESDKSLTSLSGHHCLRFCLQNCTL